MKVSIGLPVVKTEFLLFTINSVMNQSFRDYELIIVNNAEKTKVKSDIRNFVRDIKDERVFYYENAQQIAMIDNWNTVLNFAKGEYFLLLSDDDLIDINFLKEMIELLDRYPKVNLAHCRVRVIDEQGNILKITPNAPEYESSIDFLWHRLKGYRETFVSDFLVRTSALKAIGGFYNLPHGWGSDDITWIILSSNTGIVFSPNVLMSYRTSRVNITASANYPERILSLKERQSKLEELLQLQKPNSKDQFHQVAMAKEYLEHYTRSNVVFLVNLMSLKCTEILNIIKILKQYKFNTRYIAFYVIKNIFKCL